MSTIKDPDRAAILQQYARISSGGRPMLCGPPPGDDHSPRSVIYDTLEDAVAAELALRATGAGEQVPRQCPRSRRGHYHLYRKARHEH